MSVSTVAERWVEEVAGLTQPARVVWCDGSKPEYDTPHRGHARDGTLLSLNPPDVSRTAICTAATHRTSPARSS